MGLVPLISARGALAEERWRPLATKLLSPIAQDGQLPNAAIPTALATDDRGFLWVGTQNGLARWDGQRFHILNAGAGAKSLPDSQIETLHTDRRGRLWAGLLSGGLALFDPRHDQFQTFTTRQGLSYSGVHTLADAPNGDLWVGTEAGLDRLAADHRGFSHVFAANGDVAAAAALRSGVVALAQARDGVLWIGTRTGLLRRDPRTGAISTIALSNASAVSALALAADGRLWIGTDGGGAYVLTDGMTPRPIAATQKARLNGAGMRIRTILEVGPHEVWLGSYDNGILAVDPDDLSAHRQRLGNGSLLYGDENVRALHRGPDGLIFIAANNAITQFNPQHSAFITLLGGKAPTASLGERTPVSVFEDAQNRIWIGTTAHGADVIDPTATSIRHIRPTPDGLPVASIHNIDQGDGGDVLLGTDLGLYRVDPAGRNAVRLLQPGRAADARVQDIVRSGSKLWIAGRDGVWRYRMGPDQHLLPDLTVPADWLTDRRVDALMQDSRGDLWIGTDNGLNHYDTRSGRVQRLTPAADDTTTPRGFISSMTLDSHGRLWVTTFGHGVSVADSLDAALAHRFRRVDVGDGLPNSNTNRVLEDRTGQIWVSTDSGLARLDPITLKVRVFQMPDGVAVGSFFYNAGLVTDRGELVFPGRGGVVVVRPELLVRRSPSPPPLVITDIHVQGRALTGDPLLGRDPRTKLTIPAGGHGTEIGFAALSYAAPERVRYAYRLRSDRNWIEADPSRPVANLDNLSPGAHVLELRASDADGAWPVEELRVPLSVTPSWWQTWPVRLVEVLAVFGLIALLVAARTANLQRRRRELEVLVTERTRVLEAQAIELQEARSRAEGLAKSKSDFLANMSHEIRTPLNGVVGVAELLTRSPLPTREREMVEIIRASGETLQRLLSDILDVARIESGKITIEHAAFHVGAMIRAVVGLMQLKCDEKGVCLAVEIDPAIDRTATGDMVRLRQVLTNLLSNAVKFTDKGEVRLRAELLRQEPGRVQVRFEVQDTGEGIPASAQAQLFNAFEQADSSITRRFGGTGLGLSICCDLAFLMDGTLDCESAPGEGARFWVELPLPPAPEQLAGPVEPSEPDAGVGAAPLRILMADDHPTNRRVLELMLPQDVADLVSVEDGAQAVEAFGGHAFDLVLMDMQMPVMDGLTATREIRRMEARDGRRRTPIIMLTANALPEHVQNAAAAGADAHLGKPFTAQALFDKIELAMAAAEDDAPVLMECIAVA